MHKPQATGPKPTASAAGTQRPNGEPALTRRLCPQHGALYLGALFRALFSACSSSASVRVSPPSKPAWLPALAAPPLLGARACPARA